jgi:hypothetical protein
MIKHPAERLIELAGAVQRLCPDHRDPHRFHEQKSEIAASPRHMARLLAALADAAPPT